jgi:hypothetical protein
VTGTEIHYVEDRTVTTPEGWRLTWRAAILAAPPGALRFGDNVGEVPVLLRGQPNAADNGPWLVGPDGTHRRPDTHPASAPDPIAADAYKLEEESSLSHREATWAIRRYGGLEAARAAFRIVAAGGGWPPPGFTMPAEKAREPQRTSAPANAEGYTFGSYAELPELDATEEPDHRCPKCRAITTFAPAGPPAESRVASKWRCACCGETMLGAEILPLAPVRTVRGDEALQERRRDAVAPPPLNRRHWRAAAARSAPR